MLDVVTAEPVSADGKRILRCHQCGEVTIVPGVAGWLSRLGFWEQKVTETGRPRYRAAMMLT